MLCRTSRKKPRLLRINIVLLSVYIVLLVCDVLLEPYTANKVTNHQELNYTNVQIYQTQRLFALFFEDRGRVNPKHGFEQIEKNHRGICNVTREQLKGREEVDTQVLSFLELEQLFPGHHGGRFRPFHCQPSTRIAIVIPYRDREPHLKRLLLNLIPKLRRQLVDFTIYVIEQASGEAFNRGMMRNIGFIEAKKRFPYDCYVFNDVDTIIEDDRNLFRCGTYAARHLVSGVRRYNYSLPYRGLLGGIIAMTDKQMTALNGYSNMFFAWGGEDDNLYDRFVHSEFWFERTDYQDGFATTLVHRKDKKTVERFRTIGKTKHSMAFDGLSSVRYKVVYEEYKSLFTWIVVSVNKFTIEQEFELNVAKHKQSS